MKRNTKETIRSWQRIRSAQAGLSGPTVEGIIRTTKRLPKPVSEGHLAKGGPLLFLVPSQEELSKRNSKVARTKARNLERKAYVLPENPWAVLDMIKARRAKK